MTNKPDDVGVGKEFPTEWHREQYVRDLERELAGAEARKDKEYAAGVKKVLAKYAKAETGQRAAAKRPRAAASKEKRA